MASWTKNTMKRDENGAGGAKLVEGRGGFYRDEMAEFRIVNLN